MLDVTILKVKHSGSTQARKLLPYIQSCDVFAPESFACTYQNAQLLEEDWIRTLDANLTRTAFQEISRRSSSHLPAVQQEYELTMSDYLWRAKRPIWFVERFTEAQAQELWSLDEKSREEYHDAEDSLLNRDVEGFLSKWYQGLTLETSIVNITDKHTGASISSCQSPVYVRYPALAGKDPLRLTIQVGALHYPEQHISKDIPTAVVNLDPEPRDAHDLLDRAWSMDPSFESMKEPILRLGLQIISKRHNKRYTFDNLKAMSYDEMARLATS